jgi:S1-C subfamily serine protease
MRKRLVFLCAVLAILAILLRLYALNSNVFAVSAENKALKSVAQIKEEIKHSIVLIKSYAPEDSLDLALEGRGSGFVIAVDDKLYVVTAYHVVSNSKELWGMVDDISIPPFKLEVLGYSEPLDLALLEIKSNVQGLKPLSIGDSNKLLPNEPVVTIGSPLGFRFLDSIGIVKIPEAPPVDESPSIILSDIKVNRGDSGGPLLNLYGEVVGINRAIIGNNPFTISAPIEHLKAVLPRLKLGGRLLHATSGVKIANSWELTPQDYNLLRIYPPRRHGVLVTEVREGSPAKEAGIKAGDLILGANFKGEMLNFSNVNALLKFIMLKAIPDDEAAFFILRDNYYTTAFVRFKERGEQSGTFNFNMIIKP